MNECLEIAQEVREAQSKGNPVVAFETTILSFGLPQPLNREVAHTCEQTVRDAGCIPATVAILNGRVKVGLSSSELELFCSQAPEISKVNLQNFAAVLAGGKPGALTVAASLRACAMARLPVFATGGIGGVHRRYAQILDISSDLRAIAEYPVVVVCAGAKSILDISATLELLETLGIPVIGYGTDHFPMFFTAESPYRLDIVCRDPIEVARVARMHFACGGKGILVAVPVPDKFSISRHELELWIETALVDASAQQIGGKALTPFLLARLEQLSGGKTLAANRALIENNARVAAQIARALAQAI
ncbi:MAG: pseudouridine-5'-phosphate glycosidase [Candidatus Sumerlaeaceae bacterium]|nr:pseudouridine-5'-phosphate glycosidase [Candidatus Sumerlaeaceae bacterium]